MSVNFLASAIGIICARQAGLFRLVLPRSLPSSFKKEIAMSMEAAGGIPVPVGDGEGEYSAGAAISHRTPEDGSFDRAILLLATDGQSSELKSLETYRDLLTSGMPGGIDTLSPAVLRVDDLALEIAQLVAEGAEEPLDVAPCTDALRFVLSYIADSFREAGNDEKRWTEAFWQHAYMLAEHLPTALSMLPKGAPGYARDIVFASAGLPRPDGLAYYVGANGPPAYANIVSKFWSSQSEIERSLVEIDRVDREGHGTHPLLSIDWTSFPSTRVNLGHPLLAVAYHGVDEDDVSNWLGGWASTSEKAFFGAREAEAPSYELFSVDDEETTSIIENLGWQGLDHVLPLGSDTLRDDGTIFLGKLMIRLSVSVDGPLGEVPIALEVKPASACNADIASVARGEGFVDVWFELSKRAGANGGKWREKPFTLSVLPTRVGPGSSFIQALTLKVCAPHPSRPTAIAIEESRGTGKPVASFASDGRYEIDAETGVVGFDAGAAGSALVKLRDASATSQLAVFGANSPPRWVGGEALVRVGAEGSTEVAELYMLSPLPDHSVVDLEGYELNVELPEVETGQVNPVFASILAEPVIPVGDELRDEVLSDPRGILEQWYQENCVSRKPSKDIQSCLGTCVLEASGRGGASLAWNETIGTFSNTSTVVNLEFPRELVGSPRVDAFWHAFDALGLASFGGAQEVRAWPSALDLRGMPADRVEAYLESYSGILDALGEARIHSWLAYPFSALLYNQQSGEPEGVLLSPLHPLRLAWFWSVQQASDQVARSQVFGRVASSFLRFVDGELLPLSGAAIRGSDRWVATGLAPGPHELFTAWTFLAGTTLRDSQVGKAITLMGLELPLGAPSGLDQGGVSSALRDYMRIYPASSQLRIGLAAPSGGERYAETDEAIIAASGELLARHGDSLPGGVRIFESSNRKGQPPSAVSVLEKILPEAINSRDLVGHAPFEWTVNADRAPAAKVDLQFIEDTPVRVRTEEINDGSQSIGTSGPSSPFNRYRSWRLDETANDVSSFALGIAENSFNKLPSFPNALGKFESLKLSVSGLKLTAELRLGADLLGKHARWTITGNRYLDPSVLSSQLRRAPGNIALWEWRPAFLSREKNKGSSASVASTHPYTVFASPSSAFTEEVAGILQKCGMASADEDVRDVIANLGVRGVGLSSLLTMGHTQSLGAIGFSLAFKSLEKWESQTRVDEIRCLVPMDAIYPLIDVLGEGATTSDDRRRADLLLLSAQFQGDGHCVLDLHPVEVKMRSGNRNSFPGRGTGDLADPIEQLDSTHRVLQRVCNNHDDGGKELDLVNGALATLLEAAFSLRPARSIKQVPLEARLLGAVAAGDVRISTSPGTLLWFQVAAVGAGGGPYEQRLPTDGGPGQIFANPAALDNQATLDQLGEVVAEIVGLSSTFSEGSLQGPARSESNEPIQPTRAETTGPKEQERNEPNTGPIIKIRVPGSADSGTDAFTSDQETTAPDEQPDPPDLTGGIAVPEGIEILFGQAPAGTSSEPVYFKPSETALSQLNMGVVGDLGTGKTQFLKSMVYQLSQSGASNRGDAPKVFIFDYKHDYSEGDFPEALGAQILDPSKEPLPINFFALGTNPDDRTGIQRERVRRANFFCDLLRRISGIGQVQRNNLYTSVMEAYQSCAEGHAPSINDVFDVYGSRGSNDSVVSVLTLLRDLMIFEPDPENIATFQDLFDRNTVLNLSGLSGAGQDIVDIVATMFLDNLYTDYMKKLSKEPFLDGSDGVNRRKIDSFVLIDEAHHAMGRGFDVLMKLMLEGREFGMGVVLSSQFLSHFESGGHDWGEALSTWVVHNVRNATAKQFERIGFRRDVPRMVQQISSLETHWAYYRCVNGYNEGALIEGQPFFSLTRN